jgi:aminocarboxymuconate-semialdehyde decarboxylase
MRIVDFHNHYYPPKYMQALQSGQSSVRVTIDADGNPNIHYPGDYNIAVRGHRDIAYRQDVLDELGVAMQVLTLTTPGTHVETPATAVKLAALVNDEFKEAMDTRGRRFTALATLPLNDPAASAKELERAVRQLGMRGAMLFSNVNGVALSDRRFWPVYEVANDLDAVLYIHPEHPVGVEAMLDYWLMPLCGFLFDTTLAAASLVFSGVVERYPRINWALCHLGGTIPYLAERLDRGFKAFKDCRANIDREPSTYLKTFYYDTVNFNQGALKLAIDFAGADHILAGSDYPHQIGSIPSMLDAIARLPVIEPERTGIAGGNATRLLRLNAG